MTVDPVGASKGGGCGLRITALLVAVLAAHRMLGWALAGRVTTATGTTFSISRYC